MSTLFTKTKLYIYLIGTFLALPFLFGGILHAANDLLWQAFSPTEYSDTTIDLGENVQTVGNKVFKGSFEIGTDGIGKSAPIVVRITRFLLTLTIALSITMILYNGMIYIIETGQGKEGKSLIKNVGFIVIGILVSLFSVTIINLIQSIPTTIDERLTDNGADNEAIKGKKMSFGDFFNHVFKSKKTEKYDVRIRYVDDRGRSLAENTGGKYESGESFTFTSPYITGYTVSEGYEQVSGVVTGRDLSFKVIYISDNVYDVNNDEDYMKAIKEAIEYYESIGIKPYTGIKNGKEVRLINKNGREVSMLNDYALN